MMEFSDEQRASLGFEVFDFLQKPFLGNVQLFAETFLAVKGGGSAIDELFVGTDVVKAQGCPTADTASGIAHFKSTSFARNTAQS